MNPSSGTRAFWCREHSFTNANENIAYENYNSTKSVGTSVANALCQVGILAWDCKNKVNYLSMKNAFAEPFSMMEGTV